MSARLFHKSSLRLATVFILIVAVWAPLHSTSARSASVPPQAPTIIAAPGAAPGLNPACVLYQSDTGLGCRDATREESQALELPRDDRQLHVISEPKINQANGLTIILRATAGLEANPTAKAAFLKAAAMWESAITTPITVVIDVDFAPTFFGQPFPAGDVGFTNPQLLFAEPVYPALHGRLLDISDTQAKTDLYLKLPDILIHTDKGDTQAVVAPSPLFRVWGFIDRTADPATEPGAWGPAPAIGLDSRVNYDFDPSNGIDADKVDFDAVASHEIGHILGFTSNVGQLELTPDAPLALSGWDLFRVGPGATLEGFSGYTRPVSSGGAQYFFDGVNNFALSTGRPDGTGGDLRQASHWHDDAINNELRIGIVDPTLPAGRRETITLKDLEALNVLGYWLRPIGNSPPALKSVSSDLNGEVLTVTGSISDADGDVVQAQLEMLDPKGRLLGQTAPFQVDTGIPTSQVFSFAVRQMGSAPAAVQVSVVMIDSKGNKTRALVTDFSGGDTGGPRLNTAGYNKGALVIKGRKFGDQPLVEVNSEIITPVTGLDTVTTKKVSVAGRTTDLNLRSGANRIRIIANGLRSNLMVIQVD